MKIPKIIEIKKTKEKGKGLFASEDIKKETVIFHFEGKIGNDAETNPESLQINEDKFLESTMLFDDNLNHSCDPNCYIDWDKLNLVALKDIKKGEELTFNYCTSDWDDANLLEDCSFECKCGSKNCIGKMKGFRYLTFEQKKKIEKYLSPFLKKKFNQNK
ncbi:SET domain-containing protein [Candidatus Woesearchaeota archaeon]|nr:SET domain-containing protein [Candidatus Woesearchaeota archaeon]